MINRYSHALVVSHYEARGLTEFSNPYQSWFSRSKVRRRTHKEGRLSGARSFGTNTGSPIRLVDSPRVPSLVSSEGTVKSHRRTPSIVTEIYAPGHVDSSSVDPIGSIDGLTSNSNEAPREHETQASISLVAPWMNAEKCRSDDVSVSI